MTDQLVGRVPGALQQLGDAEDVFARALEESLMVMPYNSATEYHKSFGAGAPDPRWGAACVYQTIDVAERAVRLGAPAPIFLRDERHVAAVFELVDEIVVLDPYLLHREPLRFSRETIATGVSAAEVSSAPMRTDEQGNQRLARLHARYKTTKNGYVIRLGYSKFSPSKGQYLLSRHFSLRSSSVFDPRFFSDDMRSALTHPEQTSVSVRAVLPGLQMTAEAILPLHGFAEIDFRASDIWLRSTQGVTSQSDDTSSGAVWDSLEAALGIDRLGITDYLVKAARIYQSIADPLRPVAAYSLGSE
jgi:hypothetical protein